VLEQIPLASFASATFTEWAQHPRVREILDQQQKVLQLDEALIPLFHRFIHAAFTTSLPLPETGTSVRLCDCPEQVREFDFHFCRTTSASVQGDNAVNPDMIKGFIDVLFMVQGRWYFLDWKTDLLPSYVPEALKAVIDDVYSLQAQLYSLALLRLLGLNPTNPDHQEHYDKLMGGYVYVFLRGLDLPGQGVFSGRASWNELTGLHARLLSLSDFEDPAHE